MIATAIASFLKILAGLMDWMDGERLRRLGQLETEKAAREQAEANRAKAEVVDRQPDLPLGDVLDRLQPPDSR